VTTRFLRAGKLDGVMAKVIGRALYTDDLQLCGMLIGKILRSNLPHASVKNIDIAKAARQPGVLAVLTGRDVKNLRHLYRGSSPREARHFEFIGGENGFAES